MNAIGEHLAVIAAACKGIEDLLVKDKKDETGIEGMIRTLDKAVNAYNAFINKTIKPQFAARLRLNPIPLVLAGSMQRHRVSSFRVSGYP